MCEHEYKINKENKICLKCNHIIYKTEIYSRVVGYLRPVDAWNDSKQQEFKDRHKFDEQIIAKRITEMNK